MGAGQLRPPATRDVNASRVETFFVCSVAGVRPWVAAGGRVSSPSPCRTVVHGTRNGNIRSAVLQWGSGCGDPFTHGPGAHVTREKASRPEPIAGARSNGEISLRGMLETAISPLEIDIHARLAILIAALLPISCATYPYPPPREPMRPPSAFDRSPRSSSRAMCWSGDSAARFCMAIRSPSNCRGEGQGWTNFSRSETSRPPLKMLDMY